MRRRESLAVLVATLVWTIGVWAQPRFDIRLQAERISFEELARLFPPIRGIDLPPALRITRFEAQGPLDDVKVTFAAESAYGNVTGRVVLDVRDPRRTARGSVQVRGLELARLLDRPALPDTLTADATFDLRMAGEGLAALHGTFELTSPNATIAGYTARAIRATGRVDGRRVTVDARALAYGANVRTKGQLIVGDVLRYDLQGSVANLSLTRLPRSLPVPRVESDLAFDYQIAGTVGDLHGRVVLAPSELGGARIARGTTATFDTRSGSFDYRATGQVAQVNLERIGQIFDIQALQRDRFTSAITARFDIAAEGGSIQSLTLDITDSTIFGGRIPHLSATITPAAERLRFAAQGQFAGFDPGVILERAALDGQLTGTLDVTGAVPRRDGTLAFSALDVQGRVALDSSSLEGTLIDAGIIEATLTNGSRLHIARATLAAADSKAMVSGMYGVDPAVATDLQYLVETPALGLFADVLGVAVQGSVRLEGTVTGHDVLQASGTLSGSRLNYRNLSARDVTGRYTAAVPRSNVAAADFKAHLETAGLEVAGQTFSAVAADVTYVDRHLSVEVDAQQPERSIDAAGGVTWHPGHQELHLTRLSLGAPDAKWQLAPGAMATIEYGGERLVVHDLRLIAGPDQSVEINGDIRADTAPLRIDLTNVQLSTFEPWFKQPGLEQGSLDAQAVVRGGLSSPVITATFEVTAGSFRSIPYRSLGGRVNYDPTTVDFDVRLEQPDDAWITAEGRIPTAMLSADDANLTAAIDVTIRSSPIDLAIVQALTPAVAEVTGTLQVDAHVQGTLTDPTLDGQIVVQGGAFTVPRLGTRYTGIDTTILLQPDAVVVDNLRLFDDDGDWLSVSGRLPVKERAHGSVELQINAESFEVIDNGTADLEVDAALRITGVLTQPDVAGGVALNGSIAVDQIIDLGGNDAYALRSARSEQSGTTAAPPRDEGEGLLSAWPVAIDVQVIISRVILQGDDLQGPANLPVGLGTINVTAQGDVHLLKTQEGPMRVAGVVETVRGTYEFQNREFELVRGGTIRFTGSTEINPLLDVTARRSISAVETAVRFTGSLDDPRLELSSQPPLDQADILSLIVFNQPVIQLGAGQQASLGARAAALAAGFLGSEISDAVGAALGLDVLDIETTALTGSGFAPVVTIGEQFGGFYVRYRQQLGAETASQVVVEYEFTDSFRIQSSFTNRSDAVRPLLRRLEGSGIDAVFSFEYGGPDDQQPSVKH